MDGVEERIKQKAKEIGFDLVGITTADPPQHSDFYLWWLSQGYSGEMQYMARTVKKRINPQQVLPGAKSILCVALNYFTRDRPFFPERRVANEKTGYIARYAWGEDYHRILEKKLKALLKYIQGEIQGVRGKCYVDTGPVLEREYAERAGIGWVGKNTCLISPHLGSYLFLGVILLDVELQPDEPMTDHCGTCQLCIQACPTSALKEPYVLDARRCISYLTIEHRGEIQEDLKPLMDKWVFGCDICQEVCPWNANAKPTTGEAFYPRPDTLVPDLLQLASLTEEEFKQRFGKSAIKRAGWRGLRRNAQIALKNANNEG